MTDTTNPLGVSEHSHGAGVHVPDAKRDARTDLTGRRDREDRRADV